MNWVPPPDKNLLDLLFATTSSAPVVSNLDPGTGIPHWPTAPFPASVTVEPFEVPDSGDDPGDRIFMRYRDHALTQILRERRIFARTETVDDRGYRTDLVLRGEVSGTYEASTAQEVVHRSASPGPFFGAAIIFPNVVRGARLTYPRERYTQVMYPIAYSDLWQQIAGQIVDDLEGQYASGAKARAERCGDRLGLPPRIGQPWTEFVSCQSGYYEHLADAVLDDGSASVFIHAESGFRIYVIDDEIVSWEKPPTMPGVGAAPPLIDR